MGRNARRGWVVAAWVLSAGCGGSVHDDHAGSHTGDPTGHGGSAADGGTPMGTGGSSPDSGTVNPCADDAPPLVLGDAGLCAPPTPPAPQGSRCACQSNDSVTHPGADQCEPSRATEYGGKPCCVLGGCGFDYGKGCTDYPIGSPQPLYLEPCDKHSGAPALVRQGSIQDFALSDHIIWTAEQDATGNSTIVGTDKTTCTTALFALDTAVASVTGVPWGVFYTDERRKLAEMDEDGTQHDPLPGVVYDRTEAVATNGQKVYALLSTGSRDALVEIPGNGEAPSVVGEFDAPSNVASRLAVDGSFVFVLQHDIALTRSASSKLLRIDVATGSVDVVLDSVVTGFSAFAVSDGSVYLGARRSVSSVRLPGCFSYTILDGRPGEITAFALQADAYYWSESSRGLRFETVYSRSRSGGDVTALADLDGSVNGLQADATDVYAFVWDPDATTYRVARLAKK